MNDYIINIHSSTDDFKEKADAILSEGNSVTFYVDNKMVAQYFEVTKVTQTSKRTEED